MAFSSLFRVFSRFSNKSSRRRANSLKNWRNRRLRAELLEDRRLLTLMVTEGISGVTNGQVQRFNEVTGALIDTFVTPGSGGLQNPRGAAFGQDGHLYIADVQGNAIRKYNGSTGAFMSNFVPSMSNRRGWSSTLEAYS